MRDEDGESSFLYLIATIFVACVGGVIIGALIERILANHHGEMVDECVADGKKRYECYALLNKQRGQN
jgi:hypothetical protein